MKNIFIVAGGTGGHINAALSMGEELALEFNVIYLTGKRYLDYQLFKNKNVVHLNAKPLRSSSVLTQILNIFHNLIVLFQVLVLCIQKNPAFVIGAGGYVCGPSLLSAKMFGKSVFIIEQNAVVGLTNRLLAGISSLVFTNFKDTKGLSKIPASKVMQLGNPIRKNIKFSSSIIEEKAKILIFGGSLGATQINEALQIILDQKLATNLNILHQTGKDNRVSFKDNEGSLEYEQREFIEDMDAAYEWANIVICRSGASTVSELRIVRKPAILIPYPAATDNHQYLNAKELAQEKIFHCEVIDHNLQGRDLSEAIIKSINNIITVAPESTPPNEKQSSASLLIKQEIFKCLNL